MASPLRPADLAPLFHHRWAVPVLAELWRLGGAAKFVALQSRLGLPRESLKRILAALLDAGTVRRNPGYGHPMRPEYLATRTGGRLGPLCAGLLDALGARRGEALRKWPLTVLLALSECDGRFNQARAQLPQVSPRALASALRDLVELRLAERRVRDAYPPVAMYRPTAAGRMLVPHLRGLARAMPRPRSPGSGSGSGRKRRGLSGGPGTGSRPAPRRGATRG